jgi:hypothetical protein
MNRIYGAVCERSQSQHMACSYLQERGMIKLPASSLPPTNSPQFMNSPVLPEIDSSHSRFRRPAIKLPANLIPTKTSWIRALCLLPLVLPGMSCNVHDYACGYSILDFVWSLPVGNIQVAAFQSIDISNNLVCIVYDGNHSFVFCGYSYYYQHV